jgi:hypothetical protein
MAKSKITITLPDSETETVNFEKLRTKEPLYTFFFPYFAFKGRSEKFIL